MNRNCRPESGSAFQARPNGLVLVDYLVRAPLVETLNPDAVAEVSIRSYQIPAVAVVCRANQIRILNHIFKSIGLVRRPGARCARH